MPPQKGQAGRGVGCGCCLLLPEQKRFAVKPRRQRTVSGRVQLELRRAGTPQRVENMLRRYTLRGSTRSIHSYYEFVAELGSGAYGSVSRYRSLHHGGNAKAQEVAVKYIKWSAVGMGRCWRDPSQEEQLHRELKTLMVLDNPFIIRVREWFEDWRTGIYFVMELCEGGSLQDVLDGMCEVTSREQRIASFQERLRRHFREVSYALAYLHGMDPPIVHCDLKPENVLLKTRDPSSSVRLVDFGLVSLDRAREDTDKWTLGTQIFMAPEQFLQGEGRFSVQMDVWSLGIIFVWMITALERGSLQHPMLNDEDGAGFNPTFLDLNAAYRELPQDGTPAWRRELFGGQPASAIELADRMLVCPAEARIAMSEVLEQDWVTEHDDLTTDFLNQESVVMNMRMYPKLSKFERMLLNLIAEQISGNVGQSSELVRQLRNTFRALDTSGDGRLSKEELLEGLKAAEYPLDPEVQMEVAGLFDELAFLSVDDVDSVQADASGSRSVMNTISDSIGASIRDMLKISGELSPLTDAASQVMEKLATPCHTGTLEATPVEDDSQPNLGEGDKETTLTYTEWLAATIGYNVLSSDDALTGAFNALDTDLDGQVSQSDIVHFVGQEAAETIMSQFDNPDFLTYDDFKKLAKRLAAKRWAVDPLFIKSRQASIGSITDETDDDETDTHSSPRQSFMRRMMTASFDKSREALSRENRGILGRMLGVSPTAPSPSAKALSRRGSWHPGSFFEMAEQFKVEIPRAQPDEPTGSSRKSNPYGRRLTVASTVHFEIDQEKS
mmetsp:Transcript_18090/g.51518  ORF Transcript_18090/g.51518 Transcript_18090/m.51518 type:complete len:782 (-) Transcript_18090:101-2446(-)